MAKPSRTVVICTLVFVVMVFALGGVWLSNTISPTVLAIAGGIVLVLFVVTAMTTVSTAVVVSLTYVMPRSWWNVMPYRDSRGAACETEARKL